MATNYTNAEIDTIVTSWEMIEGDSRTLPGDLAYNPDSETLSAVLWVGHPASAFENVTIFRRPVVAEPPRSLGDLIPRIPGPNPDRGFFVSPCGFPLPRIL
jgi:hypothetical protein